MTEKDRKRILAVCKAVSKANNDAVSGIIGKLILCKDCMHYNTDLKGFGFCMKGNLVHSRNGEETEHPNGYCSEAERKK